MIKEMDILDSGAKVYKLVGPVLTNQSVNESK